MVRLWNTGDRPAIARLTAGLHLAGAEQLNLLEDSLGPLAVVGGRTVELPVRGKQIVTVRLRPAQEGHAPTSACY